MGLWNFFRQKAKESQNEMKNYLQNEIMKSIQNWEKEDIYAISLYVYNNYDNPCEPIVILGYNTNENFNNQISKAAGKLEAMWNYAFWLQNDEFNFGENETQEIVKRWIKQKGYRYYTYDEMFNLSCDPDPETYENIPEEFVRELIEIVKQLHKSGYIKSQFGKSIPILIHELEYYDKIAQWNIGANPDVDLSDFLRFCSGEE